MLKFPNELKSGLAALILLLSPQLSFASPVTTNDLSSQDVAIDRLATRCRAAKKSGYWSDMQAYCLKGEISKASVEKFFSVSSPIANLIVDSPGGDVAASLNLGRALYDRSLHLIVAHDCMSSCANYLVPASTGISIATMGRIVMHGSLPQNLVQLAQFISSQKPDYSPEAIAGMALKQWPSLRDNLAKQERDFFDHILRDDGYLRRYSELVRSACSDLQRTTGRCGEVRLVLDKAYLEAFNIKVDHWLAAKPKDCDLKKEAEIHSPIYICGFNGRMTNVRGRPKKKV